MSVESLNQQRALHLLDAFARGDLDWELRAARSYGKAEDDRFQVRKDGIRIWVSGIMT